MVITSIKQQLKDKTRVSIFVDGEYSFSLRDLDVFDEKLSKGLELTPQRIDELKKRSSTGKIYDKALGYISIRERSTKEVVDYLSRKGLESEEIQPIVEKLLSKNYLNDERFARMWIDNRLRLKGSSIRQIKQELAVKGITKDIVSLVLPDQQVTDSNSLKKLIAKKIRMSRYQDEKKLKEYLLRQGFSYESVSRALAEGVDE